MTIIGANIKSVEARQEYLNLIKLASQPIRIQHDARIAIIAWQRMKEIQKLEEKKDGISNTRNSNDNGEHILYTEDFCGIHVDNNTDIFHAQIYDAKKSSNPTAAQIAKCSKTQKWYIIPRIIYENKKLEEKNSQIERKVDLLNMDNEQLRKYHRRYN